MGVAKVILYRFGWYVVYEWNDQSFKTVIPFFRMFYISYLGINSRIAILLISFYLYYNQLLFHFTFSPQSLHFLHFIFSIHFHLSVFSLYLLSLFFIVYIFFSFSHFLSIFTFHFFALLSSLFFTSCLFIQSLYSPLFLILLLTLSYSFSHSKDMVLTVFPSQLHMFSLFHYSFPYLQRFSFHFLALLSILFFTSLSLHQSLHSPIFLFYFLIPPHSSFHSIHLVLTHFFFLTPHVFSIYLFVFLSLMDSTEQKQTVVSCGYSSSNEGMMIPLHFFFFFLSVQSLYFNFILFRQFHYDSSLSYYLCFHYILISLNFYVPNEAQPKNLWFIYYDILTISHQ